MEDLKEEAIRNFVCKNYVDLSEGKKKAQKKINKYVKYFLKRSIGPSKNGLIVVLNGGDFLTINQKGNIIGPS